MNKQQIFLLIAIVGVILLFLLILPSSELDNTPFIKDLRAAIKGTGLTDSTRGLIGAIEKLAYKLTHGGADPPNDMKRVTCSVSIINPLLRDAEFVGNPVCSKSAATNKFDCPASPTAGIAPPPPQAIPILEDQGALNVLIGDSNLRLHTFAYDNLFENSARAFTTDDCVPLATSKLTFTITNNVGSTIDTRVVVT